VRVLFYIGPWVELDFPSLKDCWVPLCDRIIKSCRGRAEFACLLGTTQHSYWEQNFRDSYGQLSRKGVFAPRELNAAFPPAYRAAHRWGCGSYSEDELASFSRFCVEKIQDFDPDLIIAFFNHSPFLQKAFPRAKILYVEAGLFSQPPYPRSWYFDAFGLGEDNYAGRFGEEWKRTPLPEAWASVLETIRKEILQRRLLRSSPFPDVLLRKDRYRKLILLPLQVSNSPSFDCYCSFRSQFEYLEYVLREIPEDVGVVVTEHPVYPQITRDWVSYFSSNYKNFVFDPVFQRYWAASQFLVGKVDAVVTVSSTVGLQSLLWEKPLVVLGKSNIAPFADARSLKGLDRILNDSHPKLQKDRLLGHLLRRYWVPDPLIDTEWMPEFFERCLHSTMDRNFYQEIQPAEKCGEWLLSQKNAPFVRKIDSGAFSVFPGTPVSIAEQAEELVQELHDLKQKSLQGTDQTPTMNQPLSFKLAIKKAAKKILPAAVQPYAFQVYTYASSVRHRLVLNRSLKEVVNHDALKRLRSSNVVQILQPTFYDIDGTQYLSGGAERYLCDLCQVIKELNHVPFIVQTGSRFWHRVHDGIDVFGVPSGSSYKLLNFIAHHSLFGTPKLRIYSPFSLASPKADANSIGISHGVFWDHKHATHFIPDIRQCFSNLKILVSVDTSTMSWFRGSLPAEVAKHAMSYVPNYVDLTHFFPASPRDDGKIKILFPRRLYEARGYFLLDAIIPDILDACPAVEIHLVGHADEVAKSAVAKRVSQYPGRVMHYNLPADRMNEAYQQADIVLIPTVASEGTSLSCLEAMATGNAIVATNVGGLSDLIINGHNGLLIDPNSDALREAITDLINDPTLRRELGNNAIKVARCFSKDRWRATWGHILTTYGGLVA